MNVFFCSSLPHEFDRFDRALIEQRTVGETDVRRVPHLERRPEHHRRQALAAVLGGNRKTDPAGVGKLLIRFLEAFGRGDLAVVPRAAFFIGDAIERIEHAARERRGLFENRIEDVHRVFAAGEFADFFDACEFAHNELHVAQGGAVRAHRVSSFS